MQAKLFQEQSKADSECFSILKRQRKHVCERNHQQEYEHEHEN